MDFDMNDYLSWYIPRIRGTSAPKTAVINLHSSGVAPLLPDDITAAGGNPWDLVARFEEGLADWLRIPKDELCFTPGATGGTLLALLALAKPGEHLLVESPIYEPMLRQARRLNPVSMFHRRPEDNWRLPVDRISKSIDEKTALVMITEPSNPSGTFCSRSEIMGLAELAAKNNAYLLINEVYRGFTDAPSFHGAADNIVVVSSLSKLIGTYGFRLGWVSANQKITLKLRGAHRNMGMPTLPAAAYGIGILEHVDKMRNEAVKTAKLGRDVVDSWVRSASGLTWTPSEGPGFGCLPLPEGIKDDIRFAENLCDAYNVLVVAGTHFGADNCIRISWMQSGEKLQEGLDRVARALEDTHR